MLRVQHWKMQASGLLFDDMGPAGHIHTITRLIKYAHSLMKMEWQSSNPMQRMICTIVGNYGRHMAFTTDPLFCTAYPLAFVHEDDPAQMTFRSQQNHPISFTGDGLLVHQLLMQDCSLHEYVMDRCHGCLLIPRECIFCPTSFHRSLFLTITWLQERGGIDEPNYVCASVSPAGCASSSPMLHTSPCTNWCTAGPPVPHSPSHSPLHSPSLDHHSRGLISSSSSSGSSSGSESGSGSASGSGSSSSSGSGSADESGAGSWEEFQAPEGSGSGGSEQSCSTSPDVVLLGDGEEAPADA